MEKRSGGLHRWIHYLTAGFLFAACMLRSLLLFEGALRIQTLLLLVACGLLFLTEQTISARWRAWFALYLVLQAALIAVLITRSDAADYFAILFAILGMQAMQRYPPRKGALVFAAFVPVMAVPLLAVYPVPQALLFVLIYTAAAGVVTSYSLATRRASEAATRNQEMVLELQATNREVQAYAAKLQGLAVTRERHRLAHDLHDSVTQTIFSMTLTTQSAALLMKQDPGRVPAQLDRLTELTRGALAEMQLLISELRPDKAPPGGLAAGLQRHIAERAAPQDLDVRWQIRGEDALSTAERQALLRLALEGINNVIKHAGPASVLVRLDPGPPPRLEISDTGRGFDPRLARSHGGIGLDSMRERAAEIGWAFAVESAPGAGTRIVVEKRLTEGRQ